MASPIQSSRMDAGARARFVAWAPALVLAKTLAVVTAPSVARAAGLQEFSVPAGCGSRTEFSHELERLLGPEATRAEPKFLHIDGGRDGTEFRLRIVLSEGARELRHADCRTLFRSAVVIAAASYQEERRRHRAEPGSTAPPPAQTRSGPPSAEDHAAPLAFRVSGGAGAAVGPLPGVAPLFELSGGVERERFGLALGVRYLSGTEERKPTGQGVHVRGLGARLLLTYEPLPELRGALGAGFYRLHGEGRGTAERLSDVAYSFEPAIEVAAIPLKTDRFALELAVGAHWAAVQSSFVIHGYGEVYRVPEFGGEGLFRLSWLIP